MHSTRSLLSTTRRPRSASSSGSGVGYKQTCGTKGTRFNKQTLGQSILDFAARSHLESARRTVLRDVKRPSVVNSGTHFLCRHAIISPMRIRLEGPCTEEVRSVPRRYPMSRCASD